MESQKGVAYDDTPEAWLERKAHSIKSAKISHALLSPGGTFEQALVKATIQDFNQLHGILFFLTKLEQRRLGLDAPPPLNSVANFLMRILIGSSSVFGKARFEAIEADASVIDQMAHQVLLTGKAPSQHLQTKKGFGFLKKHGSDGKDESTNGNG
jgi:hypothetical protein